PDYNDALCLDTGQVSQHDVGICFRLEIRFQHGTDGAISGAIDNFRRFREDAVRKDADADGCAANLLEACRGLCAKFHSDSFPCCSRMSTIIPQIPTCHYLSVPSSP